MESNPVAPKTSSKKAARLQAFLILFLSFLAMIAAIDVSVEFTVDRYWKTALRAEIERSLTQKTQMLAGRVSTDRFTEIEDIATQEGLYAGARATVVDGNGKVIADSQVSVGSLEDEGQRPEFATALHGDTGIETRNHNGIPVLYVAVPVSGGAVRMAYPLADVEIAAAHAKQLLLMGSFIAGLAALAISALAAQAIARRQSQ